MLLFRLFRCCWAGHHYVHSSTFPDATTRAELFAHQRPQPLAAAPLPGSGRGPERKKRQPLHHGQRAAQAVPLTLGAQPTALQICVAATLSLAGGAQEAKKRG
jgi:hypothetical protein